MDTIIFSVLAIALTLLPICFWALYCEWMEDREDEEFESRAVHPSVTRECENPTCPDYGLCNGRCFDDGY